jgi:hypothetical protein
MKIATGKAMIDRAIQSQKDEFWSLVAITAIIMNI